MNCPVCSTQVMPGAAFCDNCGSPLQDSAPVQSAYGQPAASGNSCPSCGEGVMPGEAFCGNCGSSLSSASPLPPTQIGIVPPAAAPSIPTQQATYVPSQPSGGSDCGSCGASLQPDSMFCDNCGASAPSSSQPPAQTPPPVYIPPQPPQQQPAYIPSQQQPPVPTPQPDPQPTYPPNYPYIPPSHPYPDTPQQSSFAPRLVVQASNTSLSVPSGKSGVLIGREDPVSNHFPDIDLTAHGGDEGGVGRRHATLHLQNGQASLEDHQSVNGTYVNRQRLQSGNPQLLNDGDELRFGRVVLMYYTS